MAGRRIGQLARVRIVDAVKGRHERIRAFRVVPAEMAADKVEHVAGRGRSAGIHVGNAVRHGHHHGGRRAVTAHVGNQDSPAAVGQRKEIVVVAAGSPRSLVMRGQLHRRNVGELGGQ